MFPHHSLDSEQQQKKGCLLLRPHQQTNADSLIRLILRRGSETARLLLTVMVEKIRLEGKLAEVILGNGSRSYFSPFSNFYAPRLQSTSKCYG